MAKFLKTVLVALIATSVPVSQAVAEQRFVEGVFTATESGTPLELIAWAEPLRSGVLKMGHGFLEDAPVLPRTFRFLVNVGGFDVIGVLAVNRNVFSQPLDRLESKTLPHTTTKLNVQTVEIGVPELEDWEKVLRMRKSLKGSDDKPLVFFIVLSNGMVRRFYPFFIDRQ